MALSVGRKKKTVSASGMLTFVVLLSGTTGAFADEKPGTEEETSSTDITVGARLGWSWLMQHSGAPPLCCAERDTWTASGPQVVVASAYELWSWLAVGLQVGLAQYRYRDGQDGAKRVDLVGVNAGPFIDFIVLQKPFELALGLHGGWAQLTGEIENTNDVPVTEVDNTRTPLGLHLGLKLPMSSDFALGLAASSERLWLSRTRHELGISVSWTP